MHSKLSPSAAHIWGALNGCPGYVKATEGLPDISSAESIEGTTVHDMGSGIIRNTLTGTQPRVPDVPVTPEMQESAKFYADYVLDKVRELDVLKQGSLGIEEIVQIPDVHALCFGTPDFYIYLPWEIHVFEYKNGHGPIDAYRNWQMTCYLSGIISKFKVTGIVDQLATAYFHVIQPNAYKPSGPIDVYKFPMHKARGDINILKSNASEALNDGAKCHSGPHCRYCKALYKCAAANKAGIDLMECVNTPILDDPKPESLGLQYSIVERAFNQIKFLKEGLETQITYNLKNGVSIPGYGLTPARGRETWIAPVEDMVEMGKTLKIDISKPGVLTPNQAIAAGIDKKTVKSLTTRLDKGLKLTNNINEYARRIFS